MFNKKINDIGGSMMHYGTLDLMARHGVEILLESGPPTVPSAAILPSPVLSLQSSDDKIGQCLACDKFGPAWNLCTTCEGSGMTYELVASPDKSDSSNVSPD